MEGIEISVNGAATVVVVRTLSGELARELRDFLSSYCYGSQLIEDTPYYSFERTVEELLKRYDSKGATSKTGFAGELMAHVLMRHTHEHLTPSSPFFNKEERAVRKGFDSIYVELGDSAETPRLWYGEVKSTTDPTGDANSIARHQFHLAADDLRERLHGDYRRSLWDSAIIDAHITLAAPDAANVKSLLQFHSAARADGIEFEKCVIASAGVFRDCESEAIAVEALAPVAIEIGHTYGFDRVMLCAMHQSAYDDMITLLRELAGSGGR